MSLQVGDVFLDEVALAMLDILRRDHEHWYRAIRRSNLLDLLNAKLRPDILPTDGNQDTPGDPGVITDRQMRQARADLVKAHFPCWPCPTGYFYGTDARDEEVAKSSILKKYLALGEVLGDITQSAAAEHERRTLGHRTEQLGLRDLVTVTGVTS